VALETVQGRTVIDGGRNGIPCCRRAVAESKLKIEQKINKKELKMQPMGRKPQLA